MLHRVLSCAGLACALRRRVTALRDSLARQMADLQRQHAAARALVEEKQRQVDAALQQGEQLAAQEEGLTVRAS